ncbi:MAG: type II TA system antitoxin MqsA family protein [Ignavibacteriota bacterium]
MKCAFCGGNALQMLETIKINYRKEDFKVHKKYYKCQDCKQQFTTDELDNVNIKQVYNQYREKYNIPFPEQLIKARESYGLSAVKMAEVLGFGTNIYRNYENGEVPNQSNGTLLNIAMQPTEFLKIVETKDSLFTKKLFDKVVHHIEKAVETINNSNYLKKLLWDDKITPNELSGYSIPSFEKFANIVLFYLEANENIFKVKMNKLLYYTDFLHFKRFGHSISGYMYQAIQMGPVPFRYDAIYDLLTYENFIDFVFAEVKSSQVVKPVALKKFDKTLFKPSELEVMDEIFKRFNKINTGELIELSHNEKGWIEENKKKGLISYQKYGYELSIN